MIDREKTKEEEVSSHFLSPFLSHPSAVCILGTTRGELDGTLSMCIVIVQLSPENQYSFTFEVNC